MKKNTEDDDEIDDMDQDYTEKGAKSINYDENMDYKINKDDEDDDLKFYIRKDKQKNKKGRRRKK